MNIPNAKERILQAAVKIFAQKGFEGSRIDEIAKEANVPKSLIYYHFKSKNEILEVLIDNFISEYLSLIKDHDNENHQAKSAELENRMKNVYYEFGQRNADIVRIMLMESLKKTEERPALFEIVKALIDKESEGHTEADYDIQERRIAEFFTNLMPNYAYVCYADSWTKYFDMDRKSFDQIYLKVYQETHGAYHKNHE